MKKWSGTAELHGESIGFFKVDPEDLAELIQETENRCRAGDRESSYDEIIRTLVQKGHFGYEDVTGIPWTELDFPEDVERANREVLPAVLDVELKSSTG